LPWSIKYLKATERQLKRLDPQIRDRILRYMREHVLEVNDPYASGKALTGNGMDTGDIASVSIGSAKSSTISW